MGDITGFKKYKRQKPSELPVKERIQNFEEFILPASNTETKEQAARCMDCGIPFCHNGCPLGNLIPDFNDAVYKEEWHKAYELLIRTNNFPEFTGRICPAPCEASCVLSINNEPVTIESIEKSIIEKAFNEGWVKPKLSTRKRGSSIAIIGSGPAGLACADELSSDGYQVTVFEKEDRIGGLLRYGIPDFKLGKDVLDRRIDLMTAAGVKFVPNTTAGVDISAEELRRYFDAIVLCGGSTIARDLSIEGRELKGVHLAMEFLAQNNRRVAGDSIKEEEEIKVTNQNVVVLGGGDTGSDCIGTSNRLQAKSVTQIELMTKPPTDRATENPWPNWPQVLRTSSSQEEGCDREWSILTKKFVSNDGKHVSGVEIVQIEWVKNEEGRFEMREKEDTVKILPCEKVFLAIGFLHGKKEGLLSQLGVNLDNRGNVVTQNYETSVPGVYAAGDMRRGQSLVVWAIAEGRSCADVIRTQLSDATEEQKKYTQNAYML